MNAAAALKHGLTAAHEIGKIQETEGICLLTRIYPINKSRLLTQSSHIRSSLRCLRIWTNHNIMLRRFFATG